jgi:hypothetical protein
MFSRASAVLAVSLLVIPAAQGKWFAKKVGAHVDLHKQLGDGISAIAQPTINSAETAGRTILGEADRIAGARIEQVGALADKQVGHVDVLLEHRIGQVDRIAATRLAQIDGIFDKDIKRIDNIAAARINDIDGRLKARVADVDALLKGNIADVDRLLGARIGEVDQIAERRLGNVETIIAKSTATLGGAVLRLIAFACLVIFAVAATWRIYKESTGAWPADGTLFGRVAIWWRKVRHRLTWQIASAAVAIGVLFVVFMQFIPVGTTETLERMHLGEMHRSLRGLDLTEAKYHASQLKVLDPTNSAYRGYALKIDLLRDVLSRPALYLTAAGIHQTLARIEQAELQLGEQRDRDIETLKALIVFRTNPSRGSAHDAAMLSAAALEREVPEHVEASMFGKAKPLHMPSDGGFALQPLAVAYVENYLSHPLAEVERDEDAPKEYDRTRLAALVSKSKSDGLTPLSHVLTFDALVRELNSKSLPAYRRMVEAKDVATRQAAAREVIAAWEAFDDALASRHSIDDTSAAYAVFGLNDAIVTRAKAYVQSKRAAIPPALNEKNYPQAAVRARMLPPRVVWAKRYLGVSGSMRDLLTLQEAERFQRHERAAIEFESAYASGDRYRAALAGAALGIDLDEGLTQEQRKAVAKAAAAAPVGYL